MAEPIFEFNSDKEAIKALQDEGRRLKQIAKSLWRLYLSSYKPTEYARHLNGTAGKRTGNSLKAIKLGRVMKLDENSYGIELTWDNDLSYHNSVMGGQKGHSIMLISEGWRVKKGRAKDVYRFGYFEGIDYIARVKEAFELGAKKGIALEVQWAGSEFKKQPKQPNVLK